MPLSLEEQSFRNLVTFYKDDLLLLSKGYPAKQVFTDGELKMLKKKGVTQVKALGWSRGHASILTDRAKTILGLD